MTMKIIRLTTYWTADQADTVVAFLDELRDMLWETYGDQIIEMRRSAIVRTESSTDQPGTPFGDTSDF